MERLVHDLRRDGVANIVLYAEPRVVGFYRLLDFALDPDGIRGMAYYLLPQVHFFIFQFQANTTNLITSSCY
uniref:N-acetyltransferase domain-containing protein n=1 Tax=Arundo donax TaxID=35708 RepID=A0A0A9H6P1_ARUDO